MPGTITNYHGWWTREEVKSDSENTYIFGDNVARYGNAGQACIRGLPNAYGIATLWKPGVPFADTKYDPEVSGTPKSIIINDVLKLGRTIKESNERVFFWPADGIGTGFARMPEEAPETFEFLQKYILCLFMAYAKDKEIPLWQGLDK